jgi:type IV pilus assembly protein PilQ
VGLGVGGATTGVGLALGAINGAFNLDVALSALESSGNGRILSTPRVTTQEQRRSADHPGPADSNSDGCEPTP